MLLGNSDKSWAVSRIFEYRSRTNSMVLIGVDFFSLLHPGDKKVKSSTAPKMINCLMLRFSV